MRRFLFVCAITLLAGCAATPSRYGTYGVVDAAASTAVANDAVMQLVALFPPALNRLDMQQSATDAFGGALTAGLRAKGYAVASYVPPRNGAAAPPAKGTPFAYTLTQQGNSNTYFLTLFVGSQTLSRIYVGENNGAYPAGAWAHKE